MTSAHSSDGRTSNFRRQWRFYRTAAGREPVREFLDDDRLPDADVARIAAAMIEVRRNGRADPDVNHLRGDIWQIEIDGKNAIYRLMFAEEGRFGQVLLALQIVNKKWQKARNRDIELAEERLADWRERGHRSDVAGRTGPARGGRGRT
jgi:phage-related protein